MSRKIDKVSPAPAFAAIRHLRAGELLGGLLALRIRPDIGGDEITLQARILPEAAFPDSWLVI
jgi:hypothetical protein